MTTFDELAAQSTGEGQRARKRDASGQRATRRCDVCGNTREVEPVDRERFPAVAAWVLQACATCRDKRFSQRRRDIAWVSQ